MTNDKATRQAMKNQPTSIFLDLGFDPLETISNDDFNSLLSVTWSKDNATGNGLEYVSLDEMFEFLRWALLLDVYYRDGVGFGMGEFKQWLQDTDLWTQFKNRNI